MRRSIERVRQLFVHESHTSTEQATWDHIKWLERLVDSQREEAKYWKERYLDLVTKVGKFSSPPSPPPSQEPEDPNALRMLGGRPTLTSIRARAEMESLKATQENKKAK